MTQNWNIFFLVHFLLFRTFSALFLMLCTIWYHLYNLKNVKYNFTKSNTPPLAFFTFWYQIAQSISSPLDLQHVWRPKRNDTLCAIWYQSVKNANWGVLLLVKLYSCIYLVAVHDLILTFFILFGCSNFCSTSSYVPFLPVQHQVGLGVVGGFHSPVAALFSHFYCWLRRKWLEIKTLK